RAGGQSGVLPLLLPDSAGERERTAGLGQYMVDEDLARGDPRGNGATRAGPRPIAADHDHCADTGAALAGDSIWRLLGGTGLLACLCAANAFDTSEGQARRPVPRAAVRC